MVTLTQKDCGAEITTEELRQVQLEMLKAFVKVCEEYNIRYYLSGGTLLGAIRHKGFIPWDDDIDVNVPRPDCEKIQTLSGGKIEKYILIRPDAAAPYPAESWRLYDESVIIESSIGGTSKIPYYLPAFVDIFPIEGLPETLEKTKRHYRRLFFSRKMINCLMGAAWHGKTFAAKVFHFMMRPFAKLLGYRFWYDNIQQTVRRYDFNKAEFVGVMTAPVHTVEERVQKNEYMPQINVEFEGMQLYAPANYDTYLCQLYGNNYMQIPPPEKRMSHHGFKIYANKNKQ